MGRYIKSVFALLLTGAVIVLFLTAGLAVIAVAAVILPFVYLWYKRKIERTLGSMQQNNQTSSKEKIIEGDYEIVNDEEKNES